MSKNDKMLSRTRKEFRNFCKENRLRYKLDECGDPTSPCRGKKFKDQLYWSGDEGYFGVFISRCTEVKYKNIKKKLIKFGCKVMQDGDQEGTFKVKHKNALKVAEFLGTVKAPVSDERRLAATKRMQKLWKSGAMKK